MSERRPYDLNNIFARILRGEIPNNTVMENEHILAFHDINPQAPVHILVIPKKSYVSIDDFGAHARPEEAQALFSAIANITQSQTITESGFRVIANTGINGGQEVPHFHLHILGGKALGPMLSHS